jgi:hypothetical protein
MVFSEIAIKADPAELEKKLEAEVERVRDQLTIRLGAILVVGPAAFAALPIIL